MLTWGGLRGALSMVLALALPEAFAQREFVVTMTFGVVLLSIIVQGTTAGPLPRALKLAGKVAAANAPLHADRG
jgi:monovalent cation:H+ antiporter, CPA1 family